MGGTDTRRSIVLVGVVTGMILLGSLAAVGLLPGQATTLPRPATASATTTTAQVSVTAENPTTTSPVTTSTTSPATTTTEGEVAPSPGSSDDPPATSSPETTAAPGAPVVDPTCEQLRELLASIEDATVRALISNEFSSVCAG
jgi:cytoskeletal protein RodZ